MKTPFEFIDLDFVGAVASTLAEGAGRQGRKRNDWMGEEWGETVEGERSAKIMRHLRGMINADRAEDKMANLAAIAANAMIMWVLIQIKEGVK